MSMDDSKTEVLTEGTPTENTETTEVIEGEFSPQPPVEEVVTDETVEVIEGEVVEGEIVEETPEEPFVEPEFITQTFYEEVYNIPEDCVEVAPPSFYKPKWDGEKWIEMGERPADPPHVPTADEKIESLQEENLVNMLAMTDMYEENIRLKEDNMNTMMALTEMYEIMMG